jgi:DNA polymerase-3 subunit gamma/tau
MRVAPAAMEDRALGEEERERGRVFAAKLGVPVLSRTWQMLLKGISEADAAARPFEAAEMALIRIAHAAHLPSFEDALRDAADGRTADRSSGPGTAPLPSSSGPAARAAPSVLSAPPPASAPARMALSASGSSPAMAVPAAAPAARNAVPVKSLADIVRLAEEHRDIQFKVQVRQHVRPVSFGENRVEVALAPGAPKTLYNDLSRRLETWTGARWLVVPSQVEGGETLAESEAVNKRAAEDEAARDPAVAEIMKRFPGTRIIGITLRGGEAESPSTVPDAPDGLFEDTPFGEPFEPSEEL